MAVLTSNAAKVAKGTATKINVPEKFKHLAEDLYGPGKDAKGLYLLKNNALLRLINLISRGKIEGYNFSMKKTSKVEYILYVTFHNSEGERLQLSFHMYSKSCEKYVRSSHKTKWKKDQCPSYVLKRM